MGFNSAFKGLNFNFLHRSPRNYQIPNFIKIRPVGAEVFHANGRTDVHEEANSGFSQFLLKRPKDNLLHPVDSFKVGTSLFGCWLDLKTSTNINRQHYVTRRMYGLQVTDSLMAVT